MRPLTQPLGHEQEVPPLYLGMWLRLALLDYLILALQGSVMGHLQTAHFTCHLAPIAAALVGFRVGASAGAANGLVLGWASGALMAEPTGIPMVLCLVIGWLAGAARDTYRVESRLIRVVLALALIVCAEALGAVLALGLTRRWPVILPWSLVVYAAVTPLADRLVEALLKEG